MKKPIVLKIGICSCPGGKSLLGKLQGKKLVVGDATFLIHEEVTDDGFRWHCHIFVDRHGFLAFLDVTEIGQRLPYTLDCEISTTVVKKRLDYRYVLSWIKATLGLIDQKYGLKEWLKEKTKYVFL